MIAAALALVLAAPLAERFWDRDLGGVERALVEARLAGAVPEDGPLFADLSRLLRCEPLERLEPGAPDAERRALVRVEEARRARLGAAAAGTETLWRDALAPGFFRLDAANPVRTEHDLVWPAERETWPGEALSVPSPAWRCARPTRARGPELPSAALVAALARAGRADAASRAAYHRAVLLARAGTLREAADAARAVDPAALPARIAPSGRLLRLELGVDPPEGYLALTADAGLRGALVAVRLRAADQHLRAGRFAQALAVAEAGAADACDGTRRAPLVRALRVQRAVALGALGRRGDVPPAVREAVACKVPSPDPDEAALRGLAVGLLAALPPDEGAWQALDAIARGPVRLETLRAYGARAAAASNWTAADGAAAALAAEGPAGTARAQALRAEISFARGDGAAFERAVSALLGARRAGRPAERERLAVDVASAAAVRLAEAPDPLRRLALERALDAIEEALPLARGPELARVREAMRNAARAELSASGKRAVPVALGEVAVVSRAEIPPVPRIEIAWPEPFSLLAVPDGRGGERAWFPPPDAVAEGSVR